MKTTLLSLALCAALAACGGDNGREADRGPFPCKGTVTVTIEGGTPALIERVQARLDRKYGPGVVVVVDAERGDIETGPGFTDSDEQHRELTVEIDGLLRCG